MECKKCGCTEWVLVRDSRGLPEAHCKDCDAFIKKLSTSEVIDYYETVLGGQTNGVVIEDSSRMPCKYCSEKYTMERGSMHTSIIKVPVDNLYCPMCGRKLTNEEIELRNARR